MILVDTSVWSQVLRRNSGRLNETQRRVREKFSELVMEGSIVMMGVIRQELLSGIRKESDFETLKKKLFFFPDTEILQEDYEKAAEFFNLCRAKGISGSSIDFLICAVAVRCRLTVFTLDQDFKNYAKILPLQILNIDESSS